MTLIPYLVQFSHNHWDKLWDKFRWDVRSQVLVVVALVIQYFLKSLPVSKVDMAVFDKFFRKLKYFWFNQTLDCLVRVYADCNLRLSTCWVTLADNIVLSFWWPKKDTRFYHLLSNSKGNCLMSLRFWWTYYFVVFWHYWRLLCWQDITFLKFRKIHCMGPLRYAWSILRKWLIKHQINMLSSFFFRLLLFQVLVVIQLSNVFFFRREEVGISQTTSAK